jgi:hypothetical protein
MVVVVVAGVVKVMAMNIKEAMVLKVVIMIIDLRNSE